MVDLDPTAVRIQKINDIKDTVVKLIIDFFQAILSSFRRNNND